MRTFENTATPGSAGRLPSGEMPFVTTSFTVAPGTSRWVARHAEIELCVVVRGSALVEVASRLARIEQGGSFLFESMESHAVHNDTDLPLVIVAAQWMPDDGRTARIDDLAPAIARFARAA